MSYHIFAGRFQPFHVGHLDVLEKGIADLGDDDVLVVAVVTAFKGVIIDTSFAKTAAEHHAPDRNPWGPLVSLRAVSQLARKMGASEQIITTILPAPDTCWLEITKWFPSDRKWIIPDSKEQFDDVKAEFFQKCGESVLRYKDSSSVSGRELRGYYLNSDYENFKMHIPEMIVDIYWNGGLYRSL